MDPIELMGNKDTSDFSKDNNNPWELGQPDYVDDNLGAEVIEHGNDIEEIRRQNREAVDKIVKQLELEPSDNIDKQIQSCAKIQKYIALTNKYNGDVMNEKSSYAASEIVDRDLYNGVVKHAGVCTSNSIEMRELLDRVNIKSECVALINRNTSGRHMAVLVELGGEYFYFDPTLERAIFANYFDLNDAVNNDKMILCAAGLGSRKYNQYYAPDAIMPRQGTEEMKPLPRNIAAFDLPMELINSHDQPTDISSLDRPSSARDDIHPGMDDLNTIAMHEPSAQTDDQAVADELIGSNREQQVEWQDLAEQTQMASNPIFSAGEPAIFTPEGKPVQVIGVVEGRVSAENPPRPLYDVVDSRGEHHTVTETLLERV